LNHKHTNPGKHKTIEGTEQVDKTIIIDQSPIGRTPRSNPATYTGVFTYIRELFAQTPTANKRGYKPGRFSFNVKGGRCEACTGDGIIKIEMHFLADVYVPCEVCNGKRYNKETLEVRYKGKNIYEVLDMTVEEALEFFENIPRIKKKLQTLDDVGLGYIKLGQPATTLSGGEAQRVKLAKELSRQSTGKTLYILDEPTTGLHFADIRKLLNVLERLRDSGNTIIVIEHNLDVIKTADHIIDLGPEGGDEGGRVIAQGTPEEVASAGTYTGQFLKQILNEDTFSTQMESEDEISTKIGSEEEMVPGESGNNNK
jgi:excinuclease ABC subunit A